MKERLQKLLAQANIGSRRASEELISKGRVRVNGVAAQLGDKADPAIDVIEVDGARLKFEAQPHVYLMLNKPKQVLSTDKPHRGDRRETVMDLLGLKEHLFSIGRLDADSEGMVVMTNDGDMSQKLSHPRYRHSKTYRVEVLGLPVAETLERWQEGIFLDDGKTAPCIVEITKGSVRGTTLRIVMTEGKKRQIRRVAAALGHPVQRLIRTHIGMLALGDLESGKWRELNAKEVEALNTPAPEIKTLRGKQRRSAAEKEAAPEPEVQEKRPTRRITPSPAADETVEKRRTPGRGVEVASYEDDAKRRVPRAKTSAEAPDEKRGSRVRPAFSDEDETPRKRRTPRTKPTISAARNIGKRRVPRATASTSPDEAPENRSEAPAEAPAKRRVPRMRRPASMGKPTPRITASDETSSRRISRTKPAASSDEQPAKRRSSRVKPATSLDEQPSQRRAPRSKPPVNSSDAVTPPKRRTSRVKPSSATDTTQDKRRKTRTRKSDAHDDKWGKPSPARERKPRRKKDSPR